MIASCPETLGELHNYSFGATTEKLADVAHTYYRCREAALAEGKVGEK